MSARPVTSIETFLKRSAPELRQALHWIAVLLVAAALLGSLAGRVNAAFQSISPDGENADAHSNPNSSQQDNPPAPAPAPGSVSLDLQMLGSVHEADNVRWSLAQGTSAREQYYSPESGVDWKALRSAELSGTIPIKAKSTWSFNDTFGYLEGYKYASGVYAGGHCALATVLRGAAHRAGLVTWYKLHWWAIPGFSYYESVSIWWGRDDLVLYNSTAQDMVLAWSLTPMKLIVWVPK